MASAACTSIVDPNDFGYDSDMDGDNFYINIDVQTLMTALAINGNQVSLYSFVEVVPGSTFTYNTAIGDYTISSFFNTRFPNMDFATCVVDQGSDKPPKCAMKFGNTYALPVLNHIGAKSNVNEFCDCTTSVGNSEECNIFALIAGFIFFKGGSDESSRTSLISLLINQSLFQLNRDSYNISFDAAKKKHLYKNDTHWRVSSYAFCSNCSIFVSYGRDTESYSVSENYYQLTHGSCNDSFSISNASQDILLDTPPSKLTEIYFYCSTTDFNAFVEALGISVGWITAFRNLFIVLTIASIIQWKRYKSTDTPEAYEYAEKNKVR